MLLSVVDLSKHSAFHDSATDVLVLRLENTTFKSDLLGLFFVDTGSKDNFDSHILKALHLPSQLAFVMLLVEDTDGLHAEIIERGNFFNGIFILNQNVTFEQMSSCVLQGAIPDSWDGKNVGVAIDKHHGSNAGR